MEKISVVLVVLNREFLERAIQNLNFNKANLTTIIMDGDEKTFQVKGKKIPVVAIYNALKLAKNNKDFIWLIVGYEKGIGDFLKMKKFLQAHGVSENNIINFELSEFTSH